MFDYSIGKKEEDHVTEASEDGTVQSVRLHEYIFDDWDWSSVAFDDRLEEKYTKNILHMQFYDDPEIEAVWNYFDFWKKEENEKCMPNIDEEFTTSDYEKLCVNINKEDLIAWEDPKEYDLIIRYEEDNAILYQIHDFEENADHSPIISDDEITERKNVGEAGGFGIILDLLRISLRHMRTYSSLKTLCLTKV